MRYPVIVQACGFLLSTHSARIIEHTATGSAHRYDDHQRYNLDKSPNFPIQAQGRSCMRKRPSPKDSPLKTKSSRMR